MHKLNYQAALLSLCLVFGSCSSPVLDETDPVGSGNGSGGAGSGGGIGGTGFINYSVGTLTGFGSVFINGNRFDTTTTEFQVNGQPATQSQLRVGMQLTAAVDFDTTAADQVDYAAALIGPITTAPDAQGQLRVLNQSVVIGANTVLDSLTLAEIVPNLSVEVSGITDANGILIASYVRPALHAELQIAGTVNAVDDNQQQITVRNVTIDLGQADLSAINIMSLQPGAPVIVTASANQFDASTNTLAAAFIAPGAAITPAEDARIELAGFVQTFDNAASFSVDGIQVNTTASTQYEAVDGLPLQAAAVTVNSLIEVEGLFFSDGIVDAQRVVVLPVENSELVGRLESIDPGNNSVTILGLTVRTTSLTRFRGDSSGTVNFESLRVGDYVEIDAAFTSTGLLATKLEIEELDEEALLEGPVTRVDANQRQIEILGISVFYDEGTDFEIELNGTEQELDEQSFLNAVSVGSIVKAKWDTFSSITVPVDELEIE